MARSRRYWHRSLSFGLALAVAALSWASPARADVGEVLDAAPLGSQVVVVVPSLQALSDAGAKLNTELALNNPMLGDMLTMMKMMGGMQQGLDDAGPMMVALPTVMAMAGGQGQPPVLMFMPVTDYDAFVGNFGAGGGGEIASIMMPGGQPGFAKRSGGFAVMSPMRGMVEQYQPGGAGAALLEKVGPAGADAMDDSAVSLLIDIESIAPMLMPMVDMGLATAQMQMQEEAADNPQAAQAAQMMQIGGDATRAVLNGMRGLAISLDADDAGIALRMTTQMKPDSGLAKALPGGADQRVSELLSRVPDSPYLVASSYDMKAINMAMMIEAMAEAMPEDMAGGSMKQLYADMVPLIEDINAASVVWYTPAQDDGQLDPASMYRTVMVVDSDDPASTRGAMGQYIASINGVELPAGAMPDGQPMTMSYKTAHTGEAMNLDGHVVDTYSFEMVFPPEMMQQMGPMAGMMQGFSSYSGYIAQTEGGVIATTSMDQALLESAIAAQADGGLGGSASVSAAMQRVPASPVMVTLVSVQGIVDMAAAAGMPMAAEEPLSPIVVAMGVEDAAGDFVIDVPFDSAAFIGQTAQQVVGMMMMGGMGGPGAQQGGGEGGETY